MIGSNKLFFRYALYMIYLKKKNIPRICISCTKHTICLFSFYVHCEQKTCVKCSVWRVFTITYLTLVHHRLRHTVRVVSWCDASLSLCIPQTLSANMGLVAMASTAILIAMGGAPGWLTQLFPQCSVFLFHLPYPQFQGQCRGLRLQWRQRQWLH